MRQGRYFLNNARWLSAYDIKIDDLNLDYKIIEGELWLKSKTQILGYLNASMENFNSDGWFCTGDSVLLCDDGFMKIIGRTQEVINVGGEKVLPAEVESVLLEIEGLMIAWFMLRQTQLPDTISEC